ncbi:unnamed protein product [Rotaria sordida]|uniref:Uncharacterized protein n=1 Tax=Rotaria sordida TaxID=392033 RepID=A0A819E351_9BILA|nr:unnamed protein product [Rotaria sordida]CAF1315525.1 unnamed protein product [Rotaria sordida]CAF1360738.1 unnamed protein product [Rotaria sordida]CAF1429216.1 unnamed protein product [Rotaria sordida]CAF1582768.1 unnamed protein product [Rotaria sordida]
MASARNLCQHSDIDGNQCTSNDYILCPHCQLQLCLKHLNYHQELLRSELNVLCNDIDRVHIDLNNLLFDSTNHREYLFKQLDEWHNQQINFINKIYIDKKQQIELLCLQSRIEFDTYRNKQEKQLKDNLIKQLRKVLKQKQIHIDDLNEMKNKLDYIQRGLNELKQLNIDIQCNNTYLDINIIKRRYIEAAKPLFNDDDNNLWESDNEDEEEEKLRSSDDHHILEETSNCKEKSSSLSISYLPSLATPSPSSSTIMTKKPPLKLVIKRLQHPTISTAIKYKLHTVNTSLPVTT